MKIIYIFLLFIYSFICKSQNLQIDTIQITGDIYQNSEIYIQVDQKYNHFKFISIVSSKKLIRSSEIVSIEFIINDSIVKCYTTKIKKNCLFGFYLEEPFKYGVISIQNRKWILVNKDF